MSVARDLFDLRMAGLYLPSLVLITIQPNVPWLHLISFFSLLAAVYFHGLSRNVFGVGGPEENPLERSQAIQGIQVAIAGKGPHERLPDSIPRIAAEVLLNPFYLGITSWVFVLIGGISWLIWTGGTALSLYFSAVKFSQLESGPQILVFAEYVWVLQWAVWRFFTPSYALEEDDFE